MNLSRIYSKSKQSKIYTYIAIVDVVALAASFLVIINAQ